MGDPAKRLPAFAACKATVRILVLLLVGAVRFELTAPCSQSRCATRLRHAPMWLCFYHGPTLCASAGRRLRCKRLGRSTIVDMAGF